MSTPKVRRRLAAAALGCTILLAACGGNDTAAGADGTPTTAGAGAGDEDAGGTGSPLEQLFGGGESANRAVEDAVAVCMRERGWQYTPSPSSMNGVAMVTAMDADFSEKYGYGITTQPPLDALGGSIADRGDDPNQKYLQTLSEADQQRYQTDLWGALPAMTASDSSEPVVVETDPNSCTAKAQKEVAKDFPEMSEEFQSRLGELFGSMEDDPKMQAAIDEWSACMAEQDFVYDSPDEIFSDLFERQQELTGGGATNGGTGDGQGNGATAGGGAVIIGTNGASGGVPQQPTLSPADQERLAKLQAEELAIAKADSACQEDTIEKVRPELEKEIVEKLRSEFPGLGGGK